MSTYRTNDAKLGPLYYSYTEKSMAPSDSAHSIWNGEKLVD